MASTTSCSTARSFPVRSSRPTPKPRACITRAGSGVVLRIEMRDASDQVVAEQWWQTFLVGVTLGENQGPEPPDHTFPESARAQPVGQYTMHVDLDQPTRYGEVSGDWSPHHFDRAVAQAGGFPTCSSTVCARWRCAVRPSSRPLPTAIPHASAGSRFVSRRPRCLDVDLSSTSAPARTPSRSAPHRARP